MKQFFLALFLSITSLTYSVENSWTEYWANGLKHLDNKQYIDAKEMFTTAIAQMSEDELQQNPDLLIQIASANYALGLFDDTLQQAEVLISSHYLSDTERFICGNLIVSALWKKGMEETAVEAYFKHIVSNPIVPKCLFEESKILIKNVPQCKAYKKIARSFLTQKFCEKDTDFQEYGNVWIINLTKKCDCIKSNSKSARHPERVTNGSKRTPEVVRACCNTCSTLAVGGFVACGRIPHIGCQAACSLFVEMLRQTCEGCCYNGGIEEKCWEKFSIWKDDFNRQAPECTIPMS